MLIYSISFLGVNISLCSREYTILQLVITILRFSHLLMHSTPSFCRKKWQQNGVNNVLALFDIPSANIKGKREQLFITANAMMPGVSSNCRGRINCRWCRSLDLRHTHTHTNVYQKLLSTKCHSISPVARQLWRCACQCCSFSFIQTRGTRACRSCWLFCDHICSYLCCAHRAGCDRCLYNASELVRICTTWSFKTWSTR